MKIIKITTDNAMEEIDINTSIESYLAKCEIEEIQLLYYWNYENKIIKCYGLYIENYSNINSHSLPPNGISSILEEDSDNIILTNNIYVCAFDTNNNLVDFYISDYGNFYYIMNEQYNFEFENEIDYIDNTPNNENNVIKKKSIINKIHNNNNILDYDTNIY